MFSSKPSPIYRTDFASKITTGNFDDNMNWLSNVDWIIEAVVENLEIKRKFLIMLKSFANPEL